MTGRSRSGRPQVRHQTGSGLPVAPRRRGGPPPGGGGGGGAGGRGVVGWVGGGGGGSSAGSTVMALAPVASTRARSARPFMAIQGQWAQLLQVALSPAV